MTSSKELASRCDGPNKYILTPLTSFHDRNTMLDCVSVNGHCYGFVIVESGIIMVARSMLASHGLVYITTKRGLTLKNRVLLIYSKTRKNRSMDG